MVNDVGSSIADAQYYCVQDFQVVCDPLFISEVKIKDTTIFIHQKNVVCSNCMYSWKGQERTNPGIHRISVLFARLEKMAEIEFGGHTVRSHGAKVAKKHKFDWLILLVLVAMDAFLNFIEPFNRYTNSKMLEDLKFPFKEHDTIPMWGVPIFAVILPCIVILIYYYYRRDVYDLHHAILGLLYSVLVTAVITDSIKDAVGRPRPNFYYRCFPNGVEAFQANGDVKCHGDPKIIKEGYKSFPSGHTSWSFAGLAFLSWYLCGKVKAYDRRGHAAKLCIVLLPLLFAALVGISRVDDYWHHWTDVFTGSIIGTVVASLCYLLFFPFPHDINGWAPHASIKTREKNECQSSSIEMDTV